MSNVEEAALKAYPIKGEWVVGNQHGEWDGDINQELRKAFLQGYEQAEKDTIERAVTWLKNNANKYIVDLTETYPEAPVNIIVGGMCWEDLTKYLKDNDQH